MARGFLTSNPSYIMPGNEPALVSIDPQEAVIGGPDFTLHVHGTNFSGDSVIYFNNGPEPTDFCLLYTSPSPRDKRQSRMPSSA